jgi:prevent-host-death family protein
MERKMTVAETRARFDEVLRRVVEQGEKIIVERAGQPQVVIVSVDEYKRATEARREDWPEILSRAIQVGAQIRARRGDQPFTPPEEVLRQTREERNVQLDDLR